MKQQLLLSISVLGIAFGVAACASNGEYQLSEGKMVIRQALKEADMRAKTADSKEKALALYANIFNENSDDAEVAVAYAKALRESGHASKAVSVLSPHFVKETDNKAVALEYIKDHLEAGVFTAGEHMARNWIETDVERQEKAYVPPKPLEPKVITKDDVKSDSDTVNVVTAEEIPPKPVFYAPYEFYQLLGIALDAQGKKAEAEDALKTALKCVADKEEQAVVMNNLALNLLGQKKIDEAMNMISEAFVIAPDKPKVSRNLELISEIYKNKKK